MKKKQQRTNQAKAEPWTDARFGRRLPRLVRWFLFSVLIVLIVLVIHVYTRPTGPPSLVAEAAAAATPEVAAKMIELDEAVMQLVEIFPDEAATWNVMGWLHYRIGKQDHALTIWQYSLEIDPDFAPSHHDLGVIALELGEFETAEKHFRKNVELDPGNSAFKVELSQALVELGKSDEAIGVLRGDLQANPQAVATMAMLGHAYMQKREFVLAKGHFQAAIELGPNYTNAYKGMVDACRNLGERELAKTYANMLQEKKKQDKAEQQQMLKDYDDLSKLASTAAEIYTATAKVYLAIGDPVSAEENFLKARENVESFAPACEILAWLYKRQGRTKRAADTLTELLESDPENLSAHLTAGTMFTEMGYYEEAEKAYRGAIQLTPDLAGGYVALSRFLLQVGRKLPEAKAMAQKAANFEPIAGNFYLLALACKATKDVTGAREAVRRAAELEPLNQEYQRLRQLLSR